MPRDQVRALLAYGPKKGSLWCEIRSCTGKGHYRIAIRLTDGACACECPHFQFRCRWSTPTIYSGKVCKHIANFRGFLQKELNDLQGDKAYAHQVR